MGIGPTKFPESSGVVVTLNGALTFVKFDVAVSAEASDATKRGGTEVQVVSSAERQTDLTRVQFSVPVLLPAGDRQQA